MTPEYYANEYKRYVEFLPSYGQHAPFKYRHGPERQ